jgi:AraC family transcriptional regulator, regulatory protein of adaptative response / methylated-DNA-[protein]-cysteine methyltransferase
MITKRPEQQDTYTTISRAIDYIRTQADQQPTLAQIAAAVNLSEYHLQRTFSEWAGLSPKRFLQFLTKEYAKSALRESKDLLTTSLESGLSGPGRLHDLMISCEAMSPGEIKRQGEGVNMIFGMAMSPFGNALIAWTTRGICHLTFCSGNCQEQQRELFQVWPNAKIERDDGAALELLHKVFPAEPKPGKLHLLLRGTNFQIKVWEALLNIGSAQIISYTTLARMASSPNAQRTVGTALAANRIGVLIPCHRVIRQSGEQGLYRWGTTRKQAIQAWEAARNEASKGSGSAVRR